MLWLISMYQTTEVNYTRHSSQPGVRRPGFTHS
jgi:hypothetical protein